MAQAKRKDIAQACALLGAQLKAGASLALAVERMGRSQKQYSDEWQHALSRVQSGEPLSHAVEDFWPKDILQTLIASERSGSTVYVLASIRRALQVEGEVNKELNKLIYPGVIMLASLLVGLGFIVFVIPTMFEGLPKRALESGLAKDILSFQALWLANKDWLMLAIPAAAFALFKWATSPDGKAFFIGILLQFPGLSQGYRLLRFSLWSRYMGMNLNAGLDLHTALQSTSAVLPPILAEAIDRMDRDIREHQRPIEQAILPEGDDDPRARIPDLLETALVSGSQTGSLVSALEDVAPELEELGKMILQRNLKVANSISVLVAIALTVSPLGLFYMVLFTAMSQIG